MSMMVKRRTKPPKPWDLGLPYKCFVMNCKRLWTPMMFGKPSTPNCNSQSELREKRLQVWRTPDLSIQADKSVPLPTNVTARLQTLRVKRTLSTNIQTQRTSS